ncbi:hypothetical protein ACRFGH_26150, partial [Klebsiella pneumoniae]
MGKWFVLAFRQVSRNHVLLVWHWHYCRYCRLWTFRRPSGHRFFFFAGGREVPVVTGAFVQPLGPLRC